MAALAHGWRGGEILLRISFDFENAHNENYTGPSLIPRRILFFRFPTMYDKLLHDANDKNSTVQYNIMRKVVFSIQSVHTQIVGINSNYPDEGINEGMRSRLEIIGVIHL